MADEFVEIRPLGQRRLLLDAVVAPVGRVAVAGVEEVPVLAVEADGDPGVRAEVAGEVDQRLDLSPVVSKV